MDIKKPSAARTVLGPGSSPVFEIGLKLNYLFVQRKEEIYFPILPSTLKSLSLDDLGGQNSLKHVKREDYSINSMSGEPAAQAQKDKQFPVSDIVAGTGST